VPENGLAPNTQYKVTVGPQAKAKGGEPVPHPAAVSFVTEPTTAPPPTAPPSASPGPTAPTTGITAPRLIGSSGQALPAWSADGSALYLIDATGQLKKYLLSGGSTQIDSGVSLVAVAPDGQLAYVANGQIVDGSITVSGAQAEALGFQNGRLVALSGHQIDSLAGTVLSALTGGPTTTEDATAADFSPGGSRLAYLGASGLHILDLTSGQDSVVGAASGLGSWSSDGSRYAYPTADGVSLTGGKSIPLQGGATSVSWSSSNQLLITTASGLWLANADGSQLRELSSGAFAHATWSPANDQSFWFKRGTSIYVSSVAAGAGARGAGAESATAQVVSEFMSARQGNGDPTTFLDANGKQAFSSLTLNYDGQMRWALLLDQPGQAVVRIIPGPGAGAPLDETLTFAGTGARGPLIDGVTERPDSISAGPNVLSVTVSSTQVTVTFDSDLNPSTVAAGVTIAGVHSQASYDARSKTVVLTPTGGLDSGTSYQLNVSDGLRDVNGT
ncbi:MAG: Ig-like domain-containing protein, partial [Candidatus Dormibacteraeota bacterium]|nr:Ig-like domain-containing protein [Candidatus Dormibacteraeota bacterium]